MPKIIETIEIDSRLHPVFEIEFDGKRIKVPATLFASKYDAVRSLDLEGRNGGWIYKLDGKSIAHGWNATAKKLFNHRIICPWTRAYDGIETVVGTPVTTFYVDLDKATRLGYMYPVRAARMANAWERCSQEESDRRVATGEW